MTRQIKSFTSGKSTLMGRLKKTDLNPDAPETPLGQWLYEKEHSCYVCDHFNATYQRYLDTFFYMYKNSKEFQELFKNSKGFCMHHFRDLVEVGEKKLSVKEKQEFYPVLFSLMEENMKRLEEEVTWFCDKQDYLNRDKDWGNSKDSIQRAIQKLGGGYPADPVFKIDY